MRIGAVSVSLGTLLLLLNSGRNPVKAATVPNSDNPVKTEKVATADSETVKNGAQEQLGGIKIILIVKIRISKPQKHKE